MLFWRKSAKQRVAKINMERPCYAGSVALFMVTTLFCFCYYHTTPLGIIRGSFMMATFILFFVITILLVKVLSICMDIPSTNISLVRICALNRERFVVFHVCVSLLIFSSFARLNM